MRASFLLSLLAPASFALNKHVAIVTGGTRGIGKGIAEALASQSFDLLLTYNSDADAAAATAAELTEAYGCAVECVGGDVSQPATRDAIFAKFDEAFGATRALGAVVHNAGQYVGVTSSNADGIGPSPQLGFGDGSLLGEDGAPDLSVMHYYQRMRGDGRHEGDSTSLQRECAARARLGNGTHASRALREMIARPKLGRNERKTTERGAFEVRHVAPLCCPGTATPTSTSASGASRAWARAAGRSSASRRPAAR